MNLPKKCKLIYQPRGRAGEYARLALNVYRGCGHGCLYCYAPAVTRRARAQFVEATARAASFLETLRKEAALCAGGFVAGAVGVMGLFLLPADSMAGQVLTVAVAAVAMVLTIWLCILVLTAIDDLLRQHKEE